MSYYSIVRSQDYLEHHGILGMKWGVRRFQNPDGSLTRAGRERYGISLSTASGSGLKGTSADEKILREDLENDIKKMIVEKGITGTDKVLKDKSLQSLIADYKNEYIKDIDSQIPEKIGKIDRDKFLEYLGNAQVRSIYYDVEDKNLHTLIEKSIKDNPNASGQDYVDYIQSIWDKDSDQYFTNGKYDSEKAIKIVKENNGMSTAERKAFDLLENNLSKIPEKEGRINKVREISLYLDSLERDDPSILVYNPKINKIVAYPSFDEFYYPGNRLYKPEYSKYLQESKDGDLVLLSWGSEANFDMMKEVEEFGRD